MVYFRACPQAVLEDSDALEFVFAFANEYTEESVRGGYQKAREAEADKADAETLRALGYTARELLEMDVESIRGE